MALWEHATVTDAGRALQTKLTAGNTMVFTKFVTGSGTVPAVSLYQQTAVEGPVQEFLFSDNPYYSSEQPDEAMLTMVMTNSEVATAYDCYQIGIYARDPDEGEILYVLMQTAEPIKVPTATENPAWTTEFNVTLKYGGAETVNVYVNAAGMLTRAMADKRFMRKIEHNGKQYEFKRDEKGVYLAEFGKGKPGEATEVGSLTEKDMEYLNEIFVDEEELKAVSDKIPTKPGDLGLKTETWTFTLENGNTVTKAVYVG